MEIKEKTFLSETMAVMTELCNFIIFYVIILIICFFFLYIFYINIKN